MKCRFPVRRLLQFACLGVLGAVFAVHLEGCTAIGFAVGGMADGQDAGGGPGTLVQVPAGRHVILGLWDGSQVEGRFLGWRRDSAGTPVPGEVVPPQGAMVRVMTDQGERDVAVERIAQVSAPRNTGKLVGALAGFAVDVLVIYELQHPVHSSGGGCEGPKDDIHLLGASVPAGAERGEG